MMVRLKKCQGTGVFYIEVWIQLRDQDGIRGHAIWIQERYSTRGLKSYLEEHYCITNYWIAISPSRSWLPFMVAGHGCVQGGPASALLLYPWWSVSDGGGAPAASVVVRRATAALLCQYPLFTPRSVTRMLMTRIVWPRVPRYCICNVFCS
jgi:hypothetical protein